MNTHDYANLLLAVPAVELVAPAPGSKSHAVASLPNGTAIESGGFRLYANVYGLKGAKGAKATPAPVAPVPVAPVVRTKAAKTQANPPVAAPVAAAAPAPDDRMAKLEAGLAAQAQAMAQLLAALGQK